MKQVFASGAEMAVAVRRRASVAGITVFRVLEKTFTGRELYCDDLVTDEQQRSSGVGARADRLHGAACAASAACDTFALDSGTQRQQAHKFYFREGLDGQRRSTSRRKSPMKPMQVGLLGLGTVGSGTVEVLRRNREEIARRAGRDIVIKVASARDLKKERAVSLEGIELVADPRRSSSRPDIDIVVELIGGDTVARELVLKAIDNGKHVVTANKALLAKHGTEIFLARARRRA